MRRDGTIPPVKLPDHITERAADSGGFVATFKWGDYRYTPTQYADWLATFGPQWAATMDYCCEPEVVGGGLVRERQDRTTAMAYRFWQEYRAAPWAWVPTVQGWEISDYQRHARELAPLINEMSAHYGPASAFRVGIGTLCRRASARMIRQVVEAVAAELPDQKFHLWGVKLALMQDSIAMPGGIASVDSGAWHGLFHSNMHDWKKSGMRRQRWCYSIALPAYLAKLDSALTAPKQLTFF
jgi:hypothetical protein